MAILFVTEFKGSGRYGGGVVPVALGRPTVVSNNVNIGGAHAESAAFGSTTTLIRVHTDVICSFVIGSAPVATTANARMAADNTEYFEVIPGDKISVISNV